jgi:multidrug efflux pump subunit AcrA (membrane-fusion protein)
MELWLDAKQWSQPTQLEAQTGALAWWTAITPPSEAWRAGMSVRVEIEHGTEAAQLAIPAEAIVQDQGVPTVWVMRSGEEFVRGANLVRLAALQPDGFGHGHAH